MGKEELHGGEGRGAREPCNSARSTLTKHAHWHELLSVLPPDEQYAAAAAATPHCFQHCCVQACLYQIAPASKSNVIASSV